MSDIKPFLKYFSALVSEEIYNDYLFVTKHQWYDGEMITFRTPNYAKILNMMQIYSKVTLEDIRQELGINLSAIQKLINTLIEKKYIDKNLSDDSWRVIITPSV